MLPSLNNSKMKEIELLLSGAKNYLNEEYAPKIRKGEKFNLFKTINVTADEVRLHSRFLAELLNPAGTHGQESFFLNKFKNHIQPALEKGKNTHVLHKNVVASDSIFSEKAVVKIEYTPSEKIESETNSRLDILIESSDRKKAIIIENKIYAGEQPTQLKRYKQFGETKYGSGNFILLYLTLDGKISEHEATDNLAAGKDYYCLSYKQEIVHFLESCVTELPNATHLTVVIKHYIDLIKDLTMKEDVHEKIIDLIINSKENYQSAQLISSQLKLAQNKIQKEFWIKLYKKMQVEFDNEKSELTNDAYADESNLFEVVDSYPTLFVKKEVEVNSQKKHLSIAIQLGKRRIYFGFPDTIVNPKYGNSDATFQEDVKTHLASQSMKSDKWWLGWKYFNCHQIDFSSHENISSEIVHDVVNELKTSLNQLEEYFAKNL
jgi:predicted DNA-binding protein